MSRVGAVLDRANYGWWIRVPSIHIALQLRRWCMYARSHLMLCVSANIDINTVHAVFIFSPVSQQYKLSATQSVSECITVECVSLFVLGVAVREYRLENQVTPNHVYILVKFDRVTQTNVRYLLPLFKWKKENQKQKRYSIKQFCFSTLCAFFKFKSRLDGAIHKKHNSYFRSTNTEMEILGIGFIYWKKEL